LTGPSLVSSPIPTDWCNVRFDFAVNGDGVSIWVSWDGEIISRVGDVPSVVNAAMVFVDKYRKDHVLYMHHLLGQARARYESSGANEDVGKLPGAKLDLPPALRDGALEFTFDVEGRALVGRLTSSLAWRCSEEDSRRWATARHAALSWVIENASRLEALGFETEVLTRQQADLAQQLAAESSRA
jgi:hypothetical protein